MPQETLHASLYRDAGTYETERRKIFGRSWQFLGHESQLAQPGHYLAVTIAGYPLIAVRGKDGVIRAFHNVCRHRAGPLADDGTGACADFLTCRYHGWRYALDGRLAAARDFGPAPDFDPRAFGLHRLECQTWRGFVFANMDLEGEPLHRAIAPLDRATRSFNFDDIVFTRATTHRIRCNWKTYAENYLEGYHIPLVHPGLNAAVDAAHYAVRVEDAVAFHHAPPRDGSPVAGQWALLWPSLAVNVYANGVMMERIVPEGHTHTRLDYLYFFEKDLAPEEADRAVQSSETTTEEDVTITEAVQRNLDAGIYQTGRLSPRHEGAVGWFQNAIAQALKA
ncbi:MAG TPA: aromatic ring-hydroxylating dioxygenase subunit alpha [Rhizomicrobium sp.]|jgi:choline monooxygenase